ncbi:exodeoxyribonuclease VII large subunit [Candidatus Saccharibacteria bacterium]|nr:exodeoxyribonuclease VII large subunit [Candidatus Saccharibacteria bacterium]
MLPTNSKTPLAELPIPGEAPAFRPSELVAAINQTLEYSYSSVLLVGEVSSFKINQDKWVFFDLKDEETSVPCFMSKFQLRVPLEDGMKIVVRGVPKITKWGKFSFTVQTVQPIGEGSIKKAFEMLKRKLAEEGLFDESRKRPIPEDISRLGVISSTKAAGYADFIKILNARWGGINIKVAHTQVQGIGAPEQIIKAIKYFNEHTDVQTIVIIRGGGSADDLACFNDEGLVRAVAASKIPIVTGIGHEIDQSLTDMAADLQASTPSNAAELISKDKRDIEWGIESNISSIARTIINRADFELKRVDEQFEHLAKFIKEKINFIYNTLLQRVKILEGLNPEKILENGYAILSGKISPGSVVEITTHDKIINAEIKEIHDRTKNH